MHISLPRPASFLMQHPIRLSSNRKNPLPLPRSVLRGVLPAWQGTPMTAVHAPSPIATPTSSSALAARVVVPGTACKSRTLSLDSQASVLTENRGSEKGYGYMPPKGPQTMVETILLWSVRFKQEDYNFSRLTPTVCSSSFQPLCEAHDE